MSLVGMEFDSKHDFAPPSILLGLILSPWMWSIIFWWIQHAPVDGCSAESCNFGILTGEDESMSFYSAILCRKMSIVREVNSKEREVNSKIKQAIELFIR